MTRSLSTPRRGGDWLNALVLAAIFSTCAWINVTNAARFPSGRTPFDARAHKDYIERVEQTWRPPVATDGFEMYQPPLYYFVAALADLTHGRGKDELDEFKGAQYLGCISGIALAFLTWLTLRWDAPHDRVAQWIGTTFVAFLPMSLYMNVLVTNEVFAAAITAGAFYTVLRWLSTNALDVRRAASAGLANGAALLAKFTAVFALGSAAVVLALHLTRGKLRRLAGALATFAAAAILVCGWYYLRNAVLFGHPFVGNWDDASGFRYEQVPGYRTLAFYTRFGEVLFTHPRSAPGISWLDAHYGSMWADTYGTFFPPTDDRAYFWSQVQMIAALFPTMIMVVGFIATVASAMRRPWRDRDVLVAAFPLFTWAALVSFSMDVPAYSTVKAPFFLATVPCLALFLARGRHLLGVHCRPLRGALDVTVLSLSILSIALYRYSGG